VAKSAGAHFLGMATSSPEGYWIIPTELEAGNDEDYLSTTVCCRSPARKPYGRALYVLGCGYRSDCRDSDSVRDEYGLRGN